MKNFTFLGFSEEITTCDRCGKSELKGTTIMKHTKGPWMVEPHKDYDKFILVADKNSWIAKICNDDTDYNEALANAKLISAAPELLEALIELQTILMANEPVWYLSRHFNKAYEAIKKATE